MSRIDRPPRGAPPLRSGARGASEGLAAGKHASTVQAQRDARHQAASGPSTGVEQLAELALQRIRQVALDRPSETRALMRAIIEQTLSAEFGPDATADPAFYGLVDTVVDTLMASPDAMALLHQAAEELGGTGAQPR